jgi:hypothetical protein
MRDVPSVASAGLEVALEDIADPADVEDLWLDLECRSDCSFFQSWAWIGCWLRHLPRSFSPRVLIVRDGSLVVGLGVLIANRRRRHAFVRSNGLYLNQTGDPYYDLITIEYNGFLSARNMARLVLRRCAEWLVARCEDWDELYLSGLVPVWTEIFREIAAEIGLGVRVRDKKPCDLVDLDAIRAQGGDYLARLSRNTRYQVRRAMRLYEAEGSIALQAARSAGEALEFLAGLKELHQVYWIRQGEPGSFSNAFFERFHRALVTDRFDDGEIQLLRISVGDRPIGYLYNFVKDGWVYAYQSGFNYESDPKLKPGLTSHCLAIEHNLARGAKCYDFMAGEAQHKRSLGTRSVDMTWLVLQRDRIKYRLENTLRDLKHRAVVRDRPNRSHGCLRRASAPGPAKAGGRTAAATTEKVARRLRIRPGIR